MRDTKIRLRAWDAEAKEFVQDFILDCLGNEYQYNKCEFWGDDRKITVTQFTGKKDRNDRDIYVGDILKRQKTRYENMDEEFTLEYVGFGAYSNGVMEDNGTYYGFYLLSQSKGGSWYGPLGDGLFEVVGNRFENPELMELFIEP